jgi:hypothetical protein
VSPCRGGTTLPGATAKKNRDLSPVSPFVRLLAGAGKQRKVP